MKTINCLIVDDEPLALDVLEDYISKINFLHLVKKCENALEAVHILEEQNIGLLFLDINMPDITGIQLLNTLRSKPRVIFTTAYKEYAIEGYELDIIDYLLKPIEFERFLKAVNKASELIQPLRKEEGSPVNHNKYIFVKADYKLVRINFDDILFIEGLKDYIKIQTKEKLILTLMSMTAIEDKLPHDEFARVHRSYIISLNKIDAVSRNRVIMGKKYIPVSTPYRLKFNALISKSL